MDMMSIRRALMNSEYTEGGIIVGKDNLLFPRQNGLITDTSADSGYFLTTVYDTGDTGSKSYTASIFGNAPLYCSARYFNDLTGTSVDYWTFISTGSQSSATRTYNSVGRYIVATVYKPIASQFYIYDNTNGRYVFKGSAV